MCSLKINNHDNNLDSVSEGDRGGSDTGFTQVKIEKNVSIGSYTISIGGNKTKR